MAIKNLLTELLEKCKITDIEKVIAQERLIDIPTFIEAASSINYESGFGTHYIDLSLRIFLKDGRILYRHEYDGSECFYTLRANVEDPSRPPETDKDTVLKLIKEESSFYCANLYGDEDETED